MNHEPRLIVTHSRGWTLDSGARVPPHDLHRYACSCGWEGGASYAQESKAREHFDRHIERAMPLVEETRNPSELPTVSEWLRAGAPMREVEP